MKREFTSLSAAKTHIDERVANALIQVQEADLWPSAAEWFDDRRTLYLPFDEHDQAKIDAFYRIDQLYEDVDVAIATQQKEIDDSVFKDVYVHENSRSKGFIGRARFACTLDEDNSLAGVPCMEHIHTDPAHRNQGYGSLRYVTANALANYFFDESLRMDGFSLSAPAQACWDKLTDEGLATRKMVEGVPFPLYRFK